MRPYIIYILLFSCFSGFAQEPKSLSGLNRGKINTYAQNSVLASGSWIKLKVKNDGIYKITYNDLIQYGIDPNVINPKSIRIYGNGGGMLPESNAKVNYDDLIENSIYVNGESDGHFDTGDYILFYGQSPVKWTYDTLLQIFSHTINYYSDETYYFLTYNNGIGKRVQNNNSSLQTPTNIITKFNDFLYHEKDSCNIMKSGKEWYGEYFGAVNSQTFNFFFPNIDQNSNIFLKTNVAARNTTDSQFNILSQGYNNTITVSAITGQPASDFAKFTESTMNFFPTSPDINVTISMTSGSAGWLNFIEINAIRNLNFYGHQMIFRNVSSVGIGNISEFRMNNAISSIKIWDISDPFNIKEQQYNLNDTELNFRIPTDSLHQFIAFDGSSFSSPEYIGKVQNQNLHNLANADMIIISYPDFLAQANRLANIHVNRDNLSVIVVTPQEIYNEFSSGSQDISAIRNFIRMFYNRSVSPDDAPKYLLLFGDGSYDYKNRIQGNTNFVPAYESFNSLMPTSSYVTDDFFGLLDSTEGYNSNGILDIGIGRIPVKSEEEAKSVIDKIESYFNKNITYLETNGCNTYTKEIPGDWRNIICFIADDEDNNMHISQADEIATDMETDYKNLNVEKIYLDAFVQETGPNGNFYPDVNKALNKRIQDGALLINYTGHGGETGWAEEKILQLSDISGWKNIANLPVFATATCEFSRFDNPELTSAGETILLKPNGGGIALFTTTRIAFSNLNFNLNKSLCKFAFEKVNDEYYRLGDIIRFSKIDNGSIINNRNFVLLGDPALKLSYPENTIITTEINGHPIGITDTLMALSEVTVSGIVQNSSGQKLTNFNGILYPAVYDKKMITSTLANDPQSSRYDFYQQNHILYKGKIDVINGDFTFSFFLSKDMDNNYCVGKISYYARDSITDATGYYENSNFILGGVDTAVTEDICGPSIRLFMNDTTFLPGGVTDANPLLLAYLEDFSGINSTGISFGHEITAVLDEDTKNTIELNDYFIPYSNTYKGGAVLYPFKELKEGKHTLRVKAFDNFNNSTEAYIEFVITKPSDLSLKNIYNFPNPFRDKTGFYFEHNQPCCDMDVEINIFTISGSHIKTITQKVSTTGNEINPIIWNGCNENGYKVDSGIYL